MRAGDALVARCAACGTGLSHAPAGWKRGAGLAECTLGEPAYAERTGAWAPPRASGPIVLREWICPGCARLLETEVLAAGTDAEDDVCPEFWSA